MMTMDLKHRYTSCASMTTPKCCWPCQRRSTERAGVRVRISCRDAAWWDSKWRPAILETRCCPGWFEDFSPRCRCCPAAASIGGSGCSVRWRLAWRAWDRNSARTVFGSASVPGCDCWFGRWHGGRGWRSRERRWRCDRRRSTYNKKRLLWLKQLGILGKYLQG